MYMRSVNIAELRNRLSHYLRLVRRGHPILVSDRGRIVARIEAVHAEVAAGDERSRLAELEQRGVLRRPRKRISQELMRDLDARRPRVDADVVGALLREREDGR
jgi:antitoxin (DNA-binding transcriptional repressor) of toxin-antitoxin stability system